jgi:threonine dehydratase
MPVTFDDIKQAQVLLKGNAVRTPFLAAPNLSELTGAEVHVKFENQQVTSSFKDRGAYVKLVSLGEDERRRGAIAMSAGNHAQAVAYHARRLAIPATIVMPETTPFTKVERTRSYGAEVVLSGETLAESQEAAEAIVAERNLVLVHPYDDDRIIAGQGTIALEMLEDEPGLDAIVVPVGGGGVISGIAIAARHLKPAIEVVGVEAKLYPSMSAALQGLPAKCGGSTIAEGIAVKNVTERTVSICRKYVDDVRLVGETDIERAVMAYLAHQKTLAEGAGAAGLALLLAEPERFRDRKVGLVLSGGNIAPRILASIIYRELEREKRIVILRVQIEDRPGVLGKIATLLGTNGANILEVSHQRMFLDIPAKGAELEIMLETRDGRHAEEIVDLLENQGFVIRVLDAPGGRETPRAR